MPESLAAVVEYDRNDVGGISAVINCATLRVSDAKQKRVRQVEPRTSSVMGLLLYNQQYLNTLSFN